IEENRIGRGFLAAEVAAGEGEAVRDGVGGFGIPEAIGRTGLDPELVRRAARAIGGARAFASFEDLGVQMNRHSTLVSYLHRLLVLLTGSFGKPGTHYIPA